MKFQVATESSWKGDLLVSPGYGQVKKSKSKSDTVPDLLGETVGSVIHSIGNGGSYSTLYIGLGAEGKDDAESLRRAGGALASWMRNRSFRRVGVQTDALRDRHGDDGLSAFCEGVCLGSFRFDVHKSELNGGPKGSDQNATITFLLNSSSKRAAEAVRRAVIVSEGTNTARFIGHEPPNVINPVTLATRCKKLAGEWGLECTVLDEKQMTKHGMGGILNVGKSSATKPRMIMMKYPGKGGSRGKSAKPLVLIGKAITFDTGGYSIKDRVGMVGMKYDKCGGAAVIGAMHAVSQLKPNIPVIGIVSAAENMISGEAYRPNDIVTMMSGKTVEVISTDAEGRFVLADAMTYALKQYQPRAMIDLATLTGGIVVALGSNVGGLFCDDEELRDRLITSGKRVHERLWAMPMFDDYRDLIKGDDSDIKNSGGREAHAIIAAMFLKEFSDAKVPWAHLDIAGTGTTDKDLPYIPKGATGFGVRLLIDYITHL